MRGVWEIGIAGILLMCPVMGSEANYEWNSDDEDSFFDASEEEHVLESALLELNTAGALLAFPRNYAAPLTAAEREDIRYIITTLANKPLTAILFQRSSLEKAGERIEQVHPLKFLLCAFCDEEMKAGVHNIRSRGMIWGDFSGGLKNSLNSESQIENMREEFVADFAQTVGIDKALIQSSVVEKRWDDFIEILITNIPRKGDRNRYDS